MKIMVAVKRVVDYAVKIRVKPDKVISSSPYFQLHSFVYVHIYSKLLVFLFLLYQTLYLLMVRICLNRFWKCLWACLLVCLYVFEKKASISFSWHSCVRLSWQKHFGGKNVNIIKMDDQIQLELLLSNLFISMFMFILLCDNVYISNISLVIFICRESRKSFFYEWNVIFILMFYVCYLWYEWF